jgi:hypothetical protein
MRWWLVFLLALVPAGAQAAEWVQSLQWYDCVGENLSPTEMMTGSVGTRAVTVAIRCKTYRSGPDDGGDVRDAGQFVERTRNKIAARGLVLVETPDGRGALAPQATPMPPADKRF